jgi:hypothetical protein
MQMPQTPKTKLRRKPQRGSHEREVVDAILDEALVCHLGVIEEGGWPVVTPTLHVPLRLAADTPEPDPSLPPGIECPAYVANLIQALS